MLHTKKIAIYMALGFLISTSAYAQQKATMQAQLMNTIAYYDAQGFKNICELNKEDITQQMLVELKTYARILHGFKVAELSQTIDNSQTLALPKAIVQGLVALYTLIPVEYKKVSVFQTMPTQFQDMQIQANVYMGDKPSITWSFAHLMHPKTSTFIGVLCAYCAWHNAKFYWYGNEPVLKDIENLDAIVAYIDELENNFN
ncbi:MAG TPA: hypothetical protein PLU71_02795 [Candidatus Dependentiae bacterium]|nr:hypothetical protein [Candidatus Dependentiae bacterium]HRQ62758.1 hypothetical protein [Candidatus Dependentiae bacterium]